MIPARAVSNLHALLVRDLAAYVLGCEADQRTTQGKSRKDRTRKTYERSIAHAARLFGLPIERYSWGSLSNEREIEQALEALFPTWKADMLAGLPARRKPARYTKRHPKWQRGRRS